MESHPHSHYWGRKSHHLMSVLTRRLRRLVLSLTACARYCPAPLSGGRPCRSRGANRGCVPLRPSRLAPTFGTYPPNNLSARRIDHQIQQRCHGQALHQSWEIFASKRPKPASVACSMQSDVTAFGQCITGRPTDHSICEEVVLCTGLEKISGVQVNRQVASRRIYTRFPEAMSRSVMYLTSK